MTVEHPGFSVLVVGASYGLLPAAKLAAAGIPTTVVGRADEVASIQRDGVEIHFGPDRVLRPPMGPSGLRATTPGDVSPAAHDLVFLAVQEPQAAAPGLAELLETLAERHPIASIMNMPPPPFLERDPTLAALMTVDAWTSGPLWSAMGKARMTLAGPDPQAFRPDPSRAGILHVTLASNFKFAPFADTGNQALLARACRAASRVRAPWGKVPVNLLTRQSLYVPLAKWPMLATGNCRCLGPDPAAPISIAEAVHAAPEKSRILYDGICTALTRLSVPAEVLVPFEHYATAALGLQRPSSLAMALARGATEVERIDLLICEVLRQARMDEDLLQQMQGVSDAITTRLAANRAARD